MPISSRASLTSSSLFTRTMHSRRFTREEPREAHPLSCERNLLPIRRICRQKGLPLNRLHFHPFARLENTNGQLRAIATRCNGRSRRVEIVPYWCSENCRARPCHGKRA